MAIATTTALAIASLTATAASTGMSFAQAGKQKKAQRQAEQDAEEAMAEARKKLEVNFYENLGIQKEPYELEREALLSQGAQAIQAGVESERGAAATAGRIQLAQQQGQAGIRTAMGQELANLEKLSAAEDARLAGLESNLSLQEVAGAQQAARDAQKLSAQATEQGFKGLVSMGQQAISTFAPLYSKQSTDALGNPVSVRPDKYALPEQAAPVNPLSMNLFSDSFAKPNYNNQINNTNPYQDPFNILGQYPYVNWNQKK
jgi:hypothetical protein